MAQIAEVDLNQHRGTIALVSLAVGGAVAYKLAERRKGSTGTSRFWWTVGGGLFPFLTIPYMVFTDDRL